MLVILAAVTTILAVTYAHFSTHVADTTTWAADEGNADETSDASQLAAHMCARVARTYPIDVSVTTHEGTYFTSGQHIELRMGQQTPVRCTLNAETLSCQRDTDVGHYQLLTVPPSGCYHPGGLVIANLAAASFRELQDNQPVSVNYDTLTARDARGNTLLFRNDQLVWMDGSQQEESAVLAQVRTLGNSPAGQHPGN